MTRLAVRLRAWVLAAGLVLAAAPAVAVAADRDAGPEGATPRRERVAVTSPSWLAVAAHPAAAQAGARVLAAGGTAVDAAIAAAMVLGLVEPQSSGIGGGGLMVHYDARRQAIDVYDGRETAPRAVDPDLFLKADGTPKTYVEAVSGGVAVGVPGLVAMLDLAHRDHGRLAWGALMAPAIELAERGFPVSPRLATLLEGQDRLKIDPAARAYFFQPDGTPRRAGEWLANPAYADTLRRIARDGPAALARGPVARAIVDAVARPPFPGAMDQADLAGYRPVRRDAACALLVDGRVCGAGPPTSGGIAVAQILALVDRLDRPDDDPVRRWINRVEAMRLAYADRDRWIADPGFEPVPVEGLLDPAYLDARAALAQRGPGGRTPLPAGTPLPVRRGAAADAGHRSTTHLVMVDAAGSVVTMTATVETAFGAGRMVHGFLLNNELTDFSPVARTPDGPVANRVAPGRRPRSTMAPVLLLDGEGRPRLALGAPGGPRIAAFVAMAADRFRGGAAVQDAVAGGLMAARGLRVELEAGTDVAERAAALAAAGYEVRTTVMDTGLHAVARLADGSWQAGVDPRREGAAVGPRERLADLNAAFAPLFDRPLPAGEGTR